MGVKSKTTFNPEIFDAICALLTEGASLRKAAEKVKGCPDESTIRVWVRDDIEGCAEKYERARQLGADKLFDEIQDMADDAAGKDSAGVQAARLRVDTLKWRLARMAPWKYGDKIELTGNLRGAEAVKAIEFRVVPAPLQIEPPTFDARPDTVSEA